MRSAQLYRRRNKYFVNPLVGSDGGEPVLFAPPVVVLPVDVSTSKLGEAIQAALGASHRHAPWPTDWKGLIAPLLIPAGVKDWASFAKGALSVRVDEDGSSVTLLPSTSKQEKNAFTPLDSAFDVCVEGGDAARLGEAAVMALSRCD